MAWHARKFLQLDNTPQRKVTTHNRWFVTENISFDLNKNNDKSMKHETVLNNRHQLKIFQLILSGTLFEAFLICYHLFFFRKIIIYSFLCALTSIKHFTQQENVKFK